MGRATGPISKDNLVDLAWFGGFVAAFVVVDLGTRSLADYGSADATGPALLVDALTANPLPAVVLVALVVIAAVRCPERFLGPWSGIEQGRALRLLVAPLLVLLVWQGALQPYDFLLGRTNGFDRLLLVGLGVGAMIRPALLLAFVAQQRIMIAPLAFPFGTLPGRNIDELLVLVLATIAGAHLLVSATRRDDVSPVIGVIIAAVATHFFVPGVGKLRSGWLLDEDLRYLAPNAYAAGWLGQTDGGPAAALSGIVAAIGLVGRVATLVLELGVAVFAIDHRWFRWWLVPAIGFHVVNFVIIGYWFLGWILVEAGLILFLRRSAEREWLDRNRTPTRSLAVLATVVVGVVLFHPPRLSWFDSPVGEGYRIEAVGVSGAAYHVPFGALAPFEEDLAFAQLLFGRHRPITGSYGVVGGAERVDELRQLDDPADVDGLREPLTAEQRELRDRSERFLVEWLDRANRRAGGDGPAIDRLWAIRAPTWFWTGRAEPNYRFQEPIRSLRVNRLTSLVTDDDIRHWSTTVLVLELEPDGTATVLER